MLVRSTALAALAAATALAAGGSTATLVVTSAGHDTGVTKSTERTSHSQAGATHGADATDASETDTAPTPPPCPADVKNHGAYVSSVAKMDHDSEDPGAHGALVSAAAQSDCGKDASADESESGAQDDAKDESGDQDEKGQSGQTHGKSGETHGKSASHRPTTVPVR